MARKPFSTSIEENVQNKFKEKCKNSTPYIPMNTTLELLMKGYNEGKIKLVTDITSNEEKKEK